MKRSDEILSRILKHLSDIERSRSDMELLADELAGNDEKQRESIKHHVLLLKDRGLANIDNGFVRLTWLGHAFEEGKSAFDEHQL